MQKKLQRGHLQHGAAVWESDTLLTKSRYSIRTRKLVQQNRAATHCKPQCRNPGLCRQLSDITHTPKTSITP